MTITSAPDTHALETLRSKLKEASAGDDSVIASAARHSMGRHSLPRHGHALTFDQNLIQLDRQNSLYRVAAGARWSQVVAALDEAGFSPKVMQSNNDFGVGSTFAVNAHGWPAPYPPFGSTVHSIRMMMADGSVIRCSREDHPKLFDATLGGYGLTGIILDLDMEMVPNVWLEADYMAIDSSETGAAFSKLTSKDSNIEMIYGRMNVAKESFLEQSLVVAFRKAKKQPPLSPARSPGLLNDLRRQVFRAQTGSEDFKNFRWFAEQNFAPALSAIPVTRNTLVNQPFTSLANNRADRTDILHEYFIPADRFSDFVKACKEVVLSSYQDLLNITLRYVEADEDSLLTYATGPRIAAVMLFSQETSLRAERDMKRITRALIDRVLALGGSYYLPYRLHASQEQIEKAYPKLHEFVTEKRNYDPKLLFRNGLWDAYMS